MWAWSNAIECTLKYSLVGVAVRGEETSRELSESAYA